ncbi:MAG: thioesterase family protein [Tenuifilum sp.]|mgnify:FL=1|uniref:thioesterase family protein n=1 Tax=Tenuifilum TaxID=2760873 RepID=UPI001B4734FD|nr:thioesterase family protein [Bacteroidales bacterium]HON71414.1 thioesterase family protein [Tenuifilum sp.]MBP9029140.1 thioesterase family protein [Bacteroidales bacterium]HOU74241.1 thioesterase family protein [Tenuifilum sp.]HQE54563.1 thioesterase family protein [Tenuifilum sp.]
MEFNIPLGIEFTATEMVTKDNTASKYGSGLVDVFATPAMVALMEKAALNAVLPHLPHGFNTVGTEICVKHTKATPLGWEVHSKATLKEVDGKKLVFDVVAWDSEGEIGRGTHTRYIIDSKRFMEKFSSK